MTVSKSKRIFYFDALRAFAIICVIIVHVYAVTRNAMPEYDNDPVSQMVIFTGFRQLF